MVQSPIIRSFQTSIISRDIDSAAKFIGAGAATVGVAGSGMYIIFVFDKYENYNILILIPIFIFLVKKIYKIYIPGIDTINI